MGDLATKEKNMLKFGVNTKSSKLTNAHLFIVQNTGKPDTEMYWTPVPGSVMPQFMAGDYNFRYLGPQNAKGVIDWLKKLDAKQEALKAERRQKASGVEADYEVDIPLSDLAFGEPEDDRGALSMDVAELFPEKPKKGSKKGDAAIGLIDFELDEKE